ncbi:hypothetical protein IKN40_05635, partial [bacterium]|nr:hypothetical protein [bacterium]
MTQNIENFSNYWDKEEYCNLRQAVLVFNGNLKTECPLYSFPEVSLLTQEKKDENIQVKGVFYLTSKRFVFLPNDEFPAQYLVQATFSSIKLLSGVSNDKTMSLISFEKSFVSFQFLKTRPFFLCFEIFRNIAENTRKPQTQFQTYISQFLLNGISKSYQPSKFSSFEVEFQPVTQSVELSMPSEEEVSTTESAEESLAHFLEPIKFFLDFCNNLHFDIHIKLRILLLISLLAFALQFFPFLP